jgi:hypothetical protein
VRVAYASLDGAAQPALHLLVAEAVDDVERGQVVLRGALEERRDDPGHARQPQPAEPLDEQCEGIVVFHEAFPSVLLLSSGGPGSRVIGVGGRLS